MPPKAKDHIVLSQNAFWDFLNNIELVLVHICQKLFLAKQLQKFHLLCEKMLGSYVIGYMPLLVYSLGFYNESQKLGKSLLFYAIFSSFGKHFISRKRPCHYPSVYQPDPAPTSSFPSRHTIAVVVLSQLIPNLYGKVFFIAFMITNRLVLGLHFLTDCLAGIILGLLANKAAGYIEDLDLIIVLSVSALVVWHNCNRIVGGVLPIIVAKKQVCPSVCIVLALIKMPLVDMATKLLHPTTRYDLLVKELFASAISTFIVSFSAPYVSLFTERIQEYLFS
ncbi:PAP2 superfamily protein [Tritrichomonas foetus]|uniref:PAP2 superfamily protein n=1 Tax=Tritrichomonas foetus TaxID=1144522 RepID=A0A1J4K260_9EUKA|nr:PAP2 superfamily protein [Tritrichomonas foetus]|eukprot:OHT04872.1 PAP2 superfamily protein [Tritrichomonas foetus]